MRRQRDRRGDLSGAVEIGLDGVDPGYAVDVTSGPPIPPALAERSSSAGSVVVRDGRVVRLEAISDDGT